MEQSALGLLKMEEAARQCRISRSKAYAMARAGTLPGVVRLGGSLRVSERALTEWIAREAAETTRMPLGMDKRGDRSER
jgi:excisionase family DNA binding protein